jgi:hypothetical protein
MLFVCLSGCGGKTTEGNLMVFDVEAAIDNTRTFDLGEISETLEFVALDGSSKESLIGNISQIDESRTKFYISDRTISPLKVFDKTGKFLSTRGIIGRGPNELPNIRDIAVDYRGDNIYMTGGTSIVAYDTDGIQLARNDSIKGEQIACLDNELIVHHAYSADKPGDKRTLLDVFSPGLHLERSIDVLDKGFVDVLALSGGVIYPSASLMFCNGDSIFVKETLCDTVFRYENDKPLKPVYRLDMGRFFVPAEAFGLNPAVKWDNVYREIDDIYDWGKYIIVRVVGITIESYALSYLVLDRDDPHGGFTAVASDGKQGLFLDGIAFTPCYIRDNRLVGYIQAFDIVDNAAAITNPDLKAIAATLKEDSNPVIVVATLKR